MQEKQDFQKTATQMQAILTEEQIAASQKLDGDEAFVAQSVLRAALIMMVVHMFSRVLGMAREVLLTKHFGASAATDAFFTSELYCVFFPMLFGESLAVILVTIFSEYRAKGQKEEAWKISSSVFNLSFIFMLFWAAALYFLAPTLISMTYGFDQATLNYLFSLMTIMLPIVVFVVLMEICMGVFEAHHSFTIPSTYFVIINSAIVAAIVVLDGYMDLGIKSVAFGYTAGVVFTAVLFAFLLWKKTRSYTFTFDYKHEGVRKVAWLVMPIFLAKCSGMILGVVDQLFASTLDKGSISSLGYGFMLYFIVPSLFILALQKAFFPSLSDHIQHDEMDEASELFQKVLELLSFLVIPVSLFAFVFAEPLVKVVFERGEFGPKAVEMTSAALRWYVVGMLFVAMIEFIKAVFFAFQNTRLVMFSQIFMIILNTVLNAILVYYMAVAGLALASSIALIVVTLALLLILHKQYMHLNLRTFAKSLIALGILALIGNGICYYTYHHYIVPNYELDGSIAMLFGITGAFVPGALLYVVMCFVMRLRATALIWDILDERILSKFSFWRNMQDKREAKKDAAEKDAGADGEKKVDNKPETKGDGEASSEKPADSEGEKKPDDQPEASGDAGAEGEKKADDQPQTSGDAGAEGEKKADDQPQASGDGDQPKPDGDDDPPTG